MKQDHLPERYITRRELLKQGVYTWLLAGLPISFIINGCTENKSDKTPTNVILISLDTLRADFLACYGYDRPTSPALDLLASQGVLFEDASSPSPWTLPSHMSLLTGLYPSRHGVDSIIRKLPSNIATLASVLSRHGFATSAVVNYWLLRRDFGFDRGFGHYARERSKNTPSGTSPAVFSKAVRWLLKHHDERFFLFLHHFDLHANYVALPRYKSQFVHPYDGPMEGKTTDLIPFCPQFKETYGITRTLSNEDITHLKDLYAASIRQLDDELNQFFSFLRRQDLLDKTLIIVTSDHGEEFFEHGGLSHGFTQFQEVLHVPLIISGPGVPKGKRVKEMASIIDIMPTILGLLDIKAPPHLDGIDLSRFWQQDKSRQPQRYLFAEADCFQFDPRHEMHNIKRAVRHPRFKLHYNRHTNETALYDLINDPGETIDIAEKHPALSSSMLSELKNFMQTQREAELIDLPSAKGIEILRSLGYIVSPDPVLKQP